MKDSLATNKKGKQKGSGMELKNEYGYFTEDGKEFVITNPKTPTPWVNVVCNGEYGFVMSQTGGGFSWINDSKLSRLNRWQQDLIEDNWGRYLYIKDEEGETWSATWKPTCRDIEEFEARYGTGYNIYKGKYKSITTEFTCFVPPEEKLEIWKLKIKNNSDKKKKLSLFSYLEWCLGNGEDMHREFQKTFLGTDFDEENGILYGAKRKLPVPSFISSGMAEDPVRAFHSVNLPVDSYEGDKTNFIGRYRDVKNPQAVEKGKLTNTTGDWFDSIASLNVNIQIEPGEEKVVVFTLGSAEGEIDEKELVEKYSDLKNVNEALSKTKEFWRKLLEGLKVETPDKSFNYMTNQWLKYQAISGRLWARTGYYQCSGAYGFRDQLQDSLVFLPIKPELTKKQVLLHASNQFKDGRVYHWFHQTTDLGAKTNMTDDLLWMVFVALEYLKETGDYSVFDKEVNFVDGDGADLYTHCIKAIDLVLSRFSPRGLPLIGEGDWNDGMSSVGLKWEGESIWLGHFLYGILRNFTKVCKYRNDKERESEYDKRANKLKENINEHAWDGKWYIRATKDSGKSLGSSKLKEAKIFLNAQTWAVINHTATPERANQSMDEVEENLFKENGPLLFYPGFTTPDESVGYLSRYAPGIRENGGVYTHAATWAIPAECILKRADKAYGVYKKLSPAIRGLKNPDEYLAEPYVTAGNSDGPQSAYYKRGGWTWYSGSGVWLYKVSHEWILGIRPTWEGLLIDPCIPSHWPGFTMERDYRGAKYIMEVKNPFNVTHGVKEVTLDGEKLDKNVIPPSEKEKTYYVKVILG